MALINDLGTQVLLNGRAYLYRSLRTYNVQSSQFLKIMLFWKFRLLSPSCDMHVYGCCCFLLFVFFKITSVGTVTQHSLEERTGHGQILLKGSRQHWRIPGWMGGPLQRWSRAAKPHIPTGSLTGLPEGSGHAAEEWSKVVFRSVNVIVNAAAWGKRNCDPGSVCPLNFGETSTLMKLMQCMLDIDWPTFEWSVCVYVHQAKLESMRAAAHSTY